MAATADTKDSLRQITPANAITDVAEAMPNVFIPPYTDCRMPLDGVAGDGDAGRVCTQVAISGSTEPGRYFPDYGSCEIVRTQRPFWEAPPAAEPDEADPRLADQGFMKELAWAKEQVAASGCTCCHDSRVGKVGQWDIDAEPIWITTLSDSGLALFAGYADSSVLGAYPPEDNNGFDRNTLGIPTTDNERMLAFLEKELAFRGISVEQAQAVPPFGGPIYAAAIAEPEVCGAGEGVSTDGSVYFDGAAARYVYVLTEDAANPGVPPNLDLPEGTLYRIDVRASAAPLTSGFKLDTALPGVQKRAPEGDLPDLQIGETYRLYVLKDVGLPTTNCIFTYGETIVPPIAAGDGSEGVGTDAPAAADPSADAEATPDLACQATTGFGEACSTDSDCDCADAPFCAVMPGQNAGICTATGCVEDPTLCPAGFRCFDLSFAGQPSICIE